MPEVWWTYLWFHHKLSKPYQSSIRKVKHISIDFAYFINNEAHFSQGDVRPKGTEYIHAPST